MKNETWIVAAKRTPIGFFQGAQRNYQRRITDNPLLFTRI